MTTPDELVRIGMLAVIRDIQECLDLYAVPPHGDIDADHLRAYLMGQLILIGGYADGEG